MAHMPVLAKFAVRHILDTYTAAGSSCKERVSHSEIYRIKTAIPLLAHVKCLDFEVETPTEARLGMRGKKFGHLKSTYLVSANVPLLCRSWA